MPGFVTGAIGFLHFGSRACLLAYLFTHFITLLTHSVTHLLACLLPYLHTAHQTQATGVRDVDDLDIRCKLATLHCIRR